MPAGPPWRVYYRVELELRSPLSIGGADSTQTDNDVVLDSRGKPLIPGSSLAGVLRSCLEPVRALEVFGEALESKTKEVTEGLTEEEREALLGKSGGRCRESAVRVYDGTYLGGNGTIGVRDSVSLRERVARDKLKFDRQVVERGAKFVTYVEVVDCARCDGKDIERALSRLHAGDVRLGSKSTRGFGSVRITRCTRLDFQEYNRDWDVFDMFDGSCWSKGDEILESVTGPSEDLVISLGLELRGAVMVREYSTEASGPDDPKFDFRQMTVHGAGEEVPVVPGTTWAGAFRDRFRSLAGEELTRTVFGFVDADEGSGSKAKSPLTFEDTELGGGEWVDLTHNAIDRFTGGTIDRALFSERTYYGGETTLSLHLKSPEKIIEIDNDAFAYLACVVADLHNGLLPVGGMASTGRGLFRVRSIGASYRGEGVDLEDLFLREDDYGLVSPDVKRIASALAEIVSEGDR